ncbi:hypothetical protein BGZ81_006758 [Podila clonocystis]|nr:hypothetical protein BGZ81_006758 [Podila clonocystis]
MASTDSGRHYYQQQQQPHQQQQRHNTNGSYTHYPDQPSSLSSRSKQHHQDHDVYSDLTPQSSFSSTSSRTNYNSDYGHKQHQTPASRSNSRENTAPSHSPRPQHSQPKQSQLNYLQTPSNHNSSNHNGPPSPISPSSPTPVKAITGQLNLTRLDDPVQDRVNFESYDQSQYQQARKKTPAPSQRPPQRQQSGDNYSQQPQRQQSGDSYGAPQRKQSGDNHGPSSALKQSGSSASARSMASSSSHHHQYEQQVGSGTLRQSPSAGSTYSAHSQHSDRHHQKQHQLNPSHSNGSPGSSSRQRQASPAPASPGSYEREYFPNQTSQPQKQSRQGQNNNHHYDSDDEDRNEGQEHHQKQALEYQQKLQQKPPSVHGEDDSDDSDSGSMLSYRRSISRLSISYKRPNAVPNISLFAPNQRPAMMNKGGALELSNSQRMIKDQREERLRQQQRQNGSNAGSASSLASIDHSRQDDGRPMKSNNRPTQPNNGHHNTNHREIDIPVRSTSAGNTLNNSGPRQQQQANHSHGQGGPYPGGPNQSGRSTPSSNHNQSYNPNLAPRHHQEDSNSPRSKPANLNLSPNDYPQRGDSHDPARSKSPSRSPGSPLPGASGSGYRQNGPLPSPRGPPMSGPNGSNYNLNPHPAHHLPSGGYVRPEEAVGPSNPMPEKAEDYVRQGIEYHEVGDIAKATHFFRTAAELGDPVGMLMYGLSVRHGWGCASNRQLAFQYLQKSAEHAVGDLKSRDSFASTAAKGELVLAIYELGICFRHGWGADKNKKTAAYYFEIAANLGDPDAQNDLAWCYYHGVGVKKDMFKSAKYYRLAAAQGLNTVGNSWIWKDKYGGMPASPTGDKNGAPF